MIKKFGFAILAVAFVVVAVFGFAAMHHDESGHMASCIGRVAQTQACEQNESTAFHVNLFQSFSLAVLSFLVAVGLFFAAVSLHRNADAPPVAGSAFVFADVAKPLVYERFMEWYSLSEKRDPIAVL